ncbi:hypothetical protein DBY21_10500 [Candidatus Gastranaerophilales bacterium]|nr:MAG: hypothetical protein DBY21_10500 [Candidatus Gastranaerophilales bacterium]
MFRKIVSKLNNQKKQKAVQGMINPISANFEPAKNDFLDGLSKRAVEMFERQCDIKNFSKLALSDMDNISHNEIMQEMLNKGVVDPFEDEKLAELANNEKFLKDLGLL